MSSFWKSDIPIDTVLYPTSSNSKVFTIVLNFSANTRVFSFVVLGQMIKNSSPPYLPKYHNFLNYQR